MFVFIFHGSGLLHVDALLATFYLRPASGSFNALWLVIFLDFERTLQL
jgi:hypothetical protein